MKIFRLMCKYGNCKFTWKNSNLKNCLPLAYLKLQSNFIEITLQHGCSFVNLQHIFRTPFQQNTSEWLLLYNLLQWMLLVSYDDWKVLFFIKMYGWYTVFFNLCIVASFGKSVLKEVHILCYLQNNITYHKSSIRRLS